MLPGQTAQSPRGSPDHVTAGFNLTNGDQSDFHLSNLTELLRNPVLHKRHQHFQSTIDGTITTSKFFIGKQTYNLPFRRRIAKPAFSTAHTASISTTMPPKRTARPPKPSLFPLNPIPKPPSQARGAIFHSSTTSLEPLQQILRVATHQPQSMDITSVISHLPNQDLEEYNSMRSLNDQLAPSEVQLLFLQNFYVDERHALGFYVSCTDEQFEDGINAGEMFFTACTDADLVREEICFEGDAEERGFSETSLAMKLWEGTWFRRGERGKKEDLQTKAWYFDRWYVAEHMWEMRVKNNMVSRKSLAFRA